MSPGTRAGRAAALDEAPIWYEAVPTVLVRTPLRPVDWARHLSAAPGGAGAAARACLAGDPVARLAVALASPSLDRALAAAEGNGGPPAGREAERLDEAALRYVVRLATRATPFGLLAGVALAGLGQRTRLRVRTVGSRRRTRVDLGWLESTLTALEGDPQVLEALPVRPNPSAYRVGDRLRLPATGRPGGVVSVRATRVAERALELAGAGCTLGELRRALRDETGDDGRRVDALVGQLVELSFVLPRLRPPFTGHGDPAATLCVALAGVPAAKAALETVAELRDRAARFDARRLASALAAGRVLAADPAQVQVDAAVGLSGATIAAAVGWEAARAAELLLRLGPGVGPRPMLDGFRRAFERRYGPEVEVPLLEVLDPELGLGDPYRRPAPRPDQARQRQAARRGVLLQELALSGRADAGGVPEVVLSPDDLLALERWHPSRRSAPRSLDLVVAVAADSPAALDAGRFTLVIGANVGANGAGRNLARFADLLPGAADVLADLARREAALDPDVLLVELSYRPTLPRLGNVVTRPRTRQHELGFDVPVGPGATEVAARDLLLSVHDGSFALRWAHDPRPVELRATHMLNVLRAPSVCRFALEVSGAGYAPLGGFDWGAAAMLPSLPRVRAGRVVLAPARWRLRREHGEAERADFLVALGVWRERLGVPGRVAVASGDNLLALDLDHDEQALQLRSLLRRLPAGAGGLVLQEHLPGLDDAFVPGPGGRFASELVVSLVLRDGRPPSPEPRRSYRHNAAPRAPRPAPSPPDRRGPGSDWLFAKWYGAPDGQDELVRGPLGTLAGELVERGVADQWFFIRYRDPDPHLRLRLHGEPDRLTAEAYPALVAAAGELTGSGEAGRLVVDTYDREVDRYGGPEASTVCESVFWADSERVRTLLVALPAAGDDGPTRLEAAVVSTHRLLADLGYDDEAILALLGEQLTRPFPAGDAYRASSRRLRRLIAGDDDLAPERHALGLDAPDARVLLAGQRLRQIEAGGGLAEPLPSIVRSLVHMHTNRLLRTGRRDETEGLVLGLLARTLLGLAASRRRS